MGSPHKNWCGDRGRHNSDHHNSNTNSNVVPSFPDNCDTAVDEIQKLYVSLMSQIASSLGA